MLKDKVRKDPGAAKKRRYQLVEMSDGTLRVRSGWAYAYILPAMALLLLFTVYPLVMVLRTAFYQKYIYITNTGKGFGLSSFAWVLKDSTFWMACKNTAILLLIALPITLILALGIALLINSIKRLQGLFQTIYFLPYVTSTIAIGMAFLWLFHSDYGYINYFLQLFGISPQKWLTDPNLMIVTLSIFSVWNGLAFKILLFLAGLQKINKQVYQAARIDGSSRRIAALHRRWLTLTGNRYDPGKHWGLAALYTEDPRFTAYYDRSVPGCAWFLRAAVERWAETL